MEKINNIIDKMKQTEKGNNDTNNTENWKKPRKYKDTCIICGKEFEFEVTPKSIWQATQWEKGWEVPKKFFCSEKCHKIYNDRKKLSEYEEWLRILPIRFRQIECDRKNFISQGINQSMFITGAVGVGKTILMAGIVKEILKNNFEEYCKKERGYISTEENHGVKWISYPGFIMELQSLFRKDGESTPFEMAEDIATFPGTLAIDDIGAEKMTAFVQQITYYIINYREQEMLHTLITSNFSLQQIDEQIDTRVSSRLAGMCKTVKLTGKDRRLQK